jgi:hypothetical protein
MVVIGTAGTPEGEDIVRKAGAHHTFNHRSPDYIDKIKVSFNSIYLWISKKFILACLRMFLTLALLRNLDNCECRELL